MDEYAHIYVNNFFFSPYLSFQHVTNQIQPVQKQQWQMVRGDNNYILLCLAWLRISSGKCLAAVVMMLHWNWVEVHGLTAKQDALGEEPDDPLWSGTHI